MPSSPLPPSSQPARFQLVAPYQPSAIQAGAASQLYHNLQVGAPDQTLLGVTGSGKTFTIAQLIAKAQRPTLVMAPNKTLAAQLYGEFKQFFPHNAVEYFVSYYDYYQPEAYNPVSDTYIEKDASLNSYIEQMRLAAVKAILSRPDTIVVSSVSAIYGLGDPQDYLKLRLILSLGETVPLPDLLQHLVSLRYVRNETDFHRGTYRVKGEVVDVFPAENDQFALRFELLDGVVDRITSFDALLGATIHTLDRAVVYPATHYVSSADNQERALSTIATELAQQLTTLTKSGRLVEAQRLKERTEYDLEMIREIGFCKGIENYSRHLTGRAPGAPPPTLFDYLPQDALLVIDESHVTVPQIGAMYKGDRSRKENLVKYGFRLPSALDNRPLKFAEWEHAKPATIYVSATPGDYEETHSGRFHVEQLMRPTGLLEPLVEVRPATTQVDDLLGEVRQRLKLGDRVLVTTLTKRMAENLTDFFLEQDVKAKYLHSDLDTVERTAILHDLRLGTFDVLVGINLLREGLDLPEVSLVAVLDADKEGFLRSSRSLIQTIGRAARNARGKVLLYGDNVTHSMQVAIDETARRRTQQRAYNLKHHVVPATIVSPIATILATPDQPSPSPSVSSPAPGAPSSLRSSASTVSPSSPARSSGHAAPDWVKLGVPEMASVVVSDLQPDRAAKLLRKLDRQMLAFATRLEFEKAALLRDEIARLKTSLFQS